MTAKKSAAKPVSVSRRVRQTVAIEHKESGLESRVKPETLAAWEANGWTLVDDGNSDVVDVAKEYKQAVEVRLSSEND